MKRITFSILITLLAWGLATGQTVLAEFKAEKKSVEIYPVVYNDSIFFSYTKDEGYENFWLQKDGNTKAAGINRPIFAITGSMSQTNYYTLRRENNLLLLIPFQRVLMGVR